MKKLVVFLSRTALAGAPFETAKAINKHSDEFTVVWIALKTSYRDGRVFPADKVWNVKDSGGCEDLIKNADLIHIQNEPFPHCPEIIAKKPRLVQFHSVPKRASLPTMLGLSANHYTIDQPMQMREYSFPTLPNIVDFSESRPLPEKDIDILFAPTNGMPTHISGSKANKEVREVLAGFLESKYKVDVFSNLDYYENLERKKRAKIVIDDLINYTWHKTAVEAGWFRAVIVSSCSTDYFWRSDITSLKNNLNSILTNPDWLEAYQKKSYSWVMAERCPQILVKIYEEVYNRILNSKTKTI